MVPITPDRIRTWIRIQIGPKSGILIQNQYIWIHNTVFYINNFIFTEVMCHMPGVCEDKDLPYIYTPSRQVR